MVAPSPQPTAVLYVPSTDGPDDDPRLPSRRERDQIESRLSREGATSFMYGWRRWSEVDCTEAVFGFTLRGRAVQLDMRLPEPSDSLFMMDNSGRGRSSDDAHDAWRYTVHAAWNTLIETVLSKLHSRLGSFEREFGMYVVRPDGTPLVGELLDRIDAAYVSSQAAAPS